MNSEILFGTVTRRTADAELEIVCESRGEEQTEELGRLLSHVLQEGDLISLRGDLGSGKTCFVRGLASGLGVPRERVRSPSFTLVNEYSGGRLPLYHLDLYRLEPSAVDRMALREYLYGNGICAVEWFERLGEQPARLDIHFTFVAANQRRIVAAAQGRRYDERLSNLARRLGAAVGGGSEQG